jgi:type IV fimbrial biogenesis protein FimT
VLMNAFPAAKSAGFSLIEMMIGLAILGILMAAGMPSFTKMLRNAETRKAAESIANGLQRARAEAVARNASVQFVLGTGATNTGWTVDYVNKPVATDPPIDWRASSSTSEGASHSDSDVSHTSRTAYAADLATAATTITFNNLGLVIANVPASPALAQVNVTVTGGSQTMRVVIGVGGNANVCDPSLVHGSSPRAC